MQSFEEASQQDTPEPTKLSTTLALLAGALLVLLLVTVIGMSGGYVDVEQAVQASPETTATTVAIHDKQTNR